MGGPGSGRKKKVDINDTVKNLIVHLRSFGVRWGDIANDLGYEGTDAIEDFRRKNPDFDTELALASLNRKALFAQKLEKAAIPDNGKVNAELAIKIAEQMGLFDKENKGPAVNINQLASGGGFLPIQVTFIESKRLPETIDVD